MIVSLLVAMDRAGAIGKDGALPWHLPADLRRFKALSLGKPILMGRKTAQSLGRALPGRRNLVLTRHGQPPFAGMEAVASIDAALQAVQGEVPELCVIGGAQVYALALPLADRLHATHVDTVVAGADTFFPAVDLAAWPVQARQWHPADATHAHAFEFVDYARP